MPVAEFAEQFKQFHVGRDISAALAKPPMQSRVSPRHGPQTEVLTQRKYPLTAWQLFQTCWEVRSPMQLPAQHNLPVLVLLSQSGPSPWTTR